MLELEDLVTDSELNQRFDAMHGELNHRFDAVAELIRNFGDRLEHRMDRMEHRIDTMQTAIEQRFDAQAARLDRHAALWQTGSRWAAKHDEWNEKVDRQLDGQAKLIAELNERIRKLEERNGSKQ